ncbi:hypothetical protein CASFOL_005032 [Castilleja foliolosa]|uniref:Reverse transcriptase Ty1/copia-type domain-containing protein n=1 Tax=Castilleja foliolosa TaxID=1961234 RepID=A0ABD3E3D3_9LAMI
MFAPVARLDTVRLVIVKATIHGWIDYTSIRRQIGISSWEINEQDFVKQPPGYVREDHEHKVCKLKKALYGLKQAPRACF